MSQIRRTMMVALVVAGTVFGLTSPVLAAGPYFPPNPPPAAGQQGGGLPAANKDRFRGVRIFDISDISRPKQVGAVQTCRGSHTHSLVVDPKDKDNVYIYVSGTSFVRQGEELAGCSGGMPVLPSSSASRARLLTWIL